MNKIDIGSFLMQSSPTQQEHHVLASTNRPQFGQQAKKNNEFQSIFKNVAPKEDTLSNVDSSKEDGTIVDGITMEQLTNVKVVNSSEQVIEEFALPNSLDEEQDQKNLEEFPSIIFNDVDMLDAELNQAAIGEELQNELLAQLQVILQALTSQMNNGESEEHFTQLTKDMHKFLQWWSRLPNQVQQSLKENGFMHEDMVEETEILRELVSLFEKRHAFAKQQMYQTNSTITQDDVQKWLQQALAKHANFDTERTNAVYVETNQNQPLQMSTKQQYILHITDSERIDAISRNLVSDVNKIVNRSQFLKQPGLDELTLTLRPQSLGDVTIRLSQINGEMTVRFLVTTQVARELFESNLHQLKPMFAPNNVVIERDTGVSDEEFYQEEQELSDDEQQEEQERQGSHDDTSQPDVSFDQLLQFLSKEANT